MATPSRLSEHHVTQLTFDDLDGWQSDDHAAALAVFRKTAADIDDPAWRLVCEEAATASNAKAFFEHWFEPVQLNDGKPGHFTGYYEPELNGARSQGGVFQTPLYKMPPQIEDGTPWLSRREILETDALTDQGLELVWIDDPVDAFFLQVQGSGRIRLAEGDMMRVGYAGRNGHPYSSIGKELIRRGTFAPGEASADIIKTWIRANPKEGKELMLHNASFVFFREINEVPSDEGPLGAMGCSVTPMRSVAVDPAYITLGAPVWIETRGTSPLHRLMVAQDIGSAIKGAQRADIFFGTGAETGQIAGRVNDPGRLIMLRPRPRVGR